jgi:mono/diheme cytochrome c family protein
VVLQSAFWRSAAFVALAAALGLPATADEARSAPNEAFDVKNAFRNICGFCHENYGRKAGKGPQLMANPNSDEFLFNRIKNGKPGYMAAFGGVFTDEQIRDMVRFIRGLRPDREP